MRNHGRSRWTAASPGRIAERVGKELVRIAMHHPECLAGFDGPLKEASETLRDIGRMIMEQSIREPLFPVLISRHMLGGAFVRILSIPGCS